MADKRPLFAKILAVLLIICLVPAAVFAIKAGVSNLYYFQAERQAVHWGGNRGRPSLQVVAHAQTLIQRALSLWPQNPEYLNLASQISGWHGFVVAAESDSPDAAISYYREALDMLRLSLRLRPAYAKTWALLAEFKVLVGERDAEWLAAREKALALGGADAKIVDRMMRL
ncbi:MAG: hypothetical protein M0Q95_14510 [Porticoccaceae bacterium]|nr:hypothetical protein [Porticoccaceae bacterium]